MVKIDYAATCRRPVEEIPGASVEKPAETKDVADFVKGIKEPKVKEMPAWKFDFAFAGSKGRKSVFSFNSEFRPFTRRRDGFGGFYEWTYIIATTEVRFNTSSDDRKNVLNIGSEIVWTPVFNENGDRLASRKGARPRLPGLSLKYNPQVETEWGFDNINVLPVNFQATLPINLYQSRRTRIRVDPFVGFESGLIARSSEVKSGWKIARPTVGANLQWAFLRRGEKFIAELNISYIRRFLLKPEVSWGVVESGGKFTEVADRASRRPKDDTVARLSFNGGWFSPFIQYEYGRVPPRFVLRNSSITTGLMFNVDFFWKRVQ
jgi:hypothetical protein